MKRSCIIFALVVTVMLTGCNAKVREEPNTYSEKIVNPYREETKKPTVAELVYEVDHQAKQILDRQYYFTYQQDSVNARLLDLGVTTNVNQVLEEVYRKGKINPDTMKLQLNIDDKVTAEKLKTLTAKFNTQSKDAGFKVKPDNTMEVIPHNIGREVNTEKALADFKSALHNKESVIPLEVKELMPKVKTEDMAAQKIEGLLATFSTSYALENQNRTSNLQKASQSLDMQVLKPGEVFSFNTTVGPRTEGTGYKEALVIIDNEYVPGVGGGVCQVSSTLYNTALLSDLEIVERHRHEFVIPYLPAGRDATVVYDQADLRFKNNTPGVILIRAQAKGGILKISFYGKKTNKKVELKTEIQETKPFETVKRYDSTLPPGETKKEQSGVKGYKSITYRIVKVGNKEVKREEISKDTYKPANTIIKIGPSRSRGAAIF